ncbi:SDR family NAD(P)-dependent oxidoreductase [Glaciihabitans sp. UYNi722]|uniref:SDR family NAD(P)-dependent oxidoreductase n=1 Tax=Glaciihabitans sp. UYNi722 TaxID=3156344 RepID=UPI003398E703
MDVDGKVIVVTGASSGIGEAAAKLLASRGAQVAVAARSQDKLNELASSLKDAFAVTVDMTDEASIKNMIQETLNHYGHIDVLVNNAGQSVIGPVAEINVEDFTTIMDLNVYGPLRALQAVLPSMRENGGGMILNISSRVSKMTIPGIGAYAATKCALNGLMLTARKELAESNIIVSVMHPGATQTNFGKNAIRNTDTPFGGGSGQSDTPEMVAEKIAEAIESEKAEQYMSDEIEQEYGTKN